MQVAPGGSEPDRSFSPLEYIAAGARSDRYKQGIRGQVATNEILFVIILF